MVRIISKFYSDGVKCSCGWNVKRLYAFEGSSIDEEGLCAECFMEMLVEEGYEVIKSVVERKGV